MKIRKYNESLDHESLIKELIVEIEDDYPVNIRKFDDDKFIIEIQVPELEKAFNESEILKLISVIDDQKKVLNKCREVIARIDCESFSLDMVRDGGITIITLSLEFSPDNLEFIRYKSNIVTLDLERFKRCLGKNSSLIEGVEQFVNGYDEPGFVIYFSKSLSQDSKEIKEIEKILNNSLPYDFFLSAGGNLEISNSYVLLAVNPLDYENIWDTKVI